LYNYLDEKSYCEKHDLEWDESKSDDCPKCIEEYEDIYDDYSDDDELFDGEFDPGNPKIFMEV
jgi:hypothetical protein